MLYRLVRTGQHEVLPSPLPNASCTHAAAVPPYLYDLRSLLLVPNMILLLLVGHDALMLFACTCIFVVTLSPKLTWYYLCC